MERCRVPLYAYIMCDIKFEKVHFDWRLVQFIPEL